jgi:hypothetical protein
MILAILIPLGGLKTSITSNIAGIITKNSNAKVNINNKFTAPYAKLSPKLHSNVLNPPLPSEKLLNHAILFYFKLLIKTNVSIIFNLSK